METILIQAKNKADSSNIRKLLRELEDIEIVSTLSSSDKEDLAMINAINKGRKGDYVDTETFLKKIKGK